MRYQSRSQVNLVKHRLAIVNQDIEAVISIPHRFEFNPMAPNTAWVTDITKNRRLARRCMCIDVHHLVQFISL